MRRLVSHTVRDGRASLSHRANTVERVIDFQFLTLGAYPWAKGHQKGRWPIIHLDLPPYKTSGVDFDHSRSFKVNLTVPMESPWVLRSSAPEVQPRICHRFRDISSQNFDCSPFDLGRANPWAKGHQKGRWPTIHVDLPSYKISARSCKRSTRYALPNFFHVLAPEGLIPGPKFTKRGEDLADNEVYHPAKFHCSMPTHARDILYKKILQTHTYTHTHNKTVNDISTTCLSACVDKKATSLDHPNSQMHTLWRNSTIGLFPFFSRIAVAIKQNG